MRWFKHDADAHTDAKLKKVKHKYGIVGYGLYWYCIELIAGKIDKNNISFSLEEDAELIAMEWNLDQLKVQDMMTFMVSLELFEENNGRITCLKLAKRLDDTNSKNPEIRGIISRLSGNNQSHSESVGETPSNSDQTRLEENRLDKNIREKNKEETKPKPQKRFVPPTIEECIEYSQDTHQSEMFYNYYESNGWKVGKNKMANWKASLTNWIKRSREYKNQNQPLNSNDLVGEGSWT